MMISPGTAYVDDNQIALDTNPMAGTLADLNDFPVVFDGDRRILLSDIATAQDVGVVQKSRVSVNGRKQVFEPIYRQGG